MIITPRDTDRIAGIVIESLIRFWRLQGHSLTGKFVRSLDHQVREAVGVTVIDFYMENYGVILDRGVSPSRVPYSPGSGARRSQYIEWLGS